MTAGLTPRDETRLVGVDPRLAAVVRLAASRTPLMVVCGLRTKAEQTVLVRTGKSWTMNSKHLTGQAVDLAPLVGGKLSWEWKHYPPLAQVVKQAADELGLPVTWGGSWKVLDGPHFEITGAS